MVVPRKMWSSLGQTNSPALFTRIIFSVGPSVKIELAVRDDLIEKVIQTIIDNARTSKIGDGKIFVINLERAYRIRTGEDGEAAL